MYFPQVLDWFSEVTSPRHFDARLLRRGQPGVDSSRRNCRTAAAKIGVGKNAGEEAGSGFPFEGMLPARML
jgi:hypothetical protein